MMQFREVMNILIRKSLPAILAVVLGGLCTQAGVAAAAIFAITPAASTNHAGDTIQLQVVENGHSITQALSFQWSRNGTNLLDSGRVSGSQTDTLSIQDGRVEDTAKYSVLLSLQGVPLAAVTSTVYVVSMPRIEDLSSQTAGDDIVFRATASGGLLSYQWLWQGRPLPGAIGSVLRFTNAFSSANAGYYAVQVSNPAGSVTSSLPGLLFTKPVPSGKYQGLFYGDQLITLESSGSFQCTLSASKRSFSGKLFIGKTGYPFSGAFAPAHDAVVSVPRSGATPLDLRLQLLTTNDTPQVIGSVSGGGWTSPLWGQRLAFSSKEPTALAGKYTLLLQNTNASSQAPNGHGYAAFTVRPDGTIVLSGRAADGTSLSQRSALSRLGDWPVHIPLYKGGGLILGWLRLVSQSGLANAQGPQLVWIKEAGYDNAYPGGFSLPLLAEGFKYLLPASDTVIPLTNGVAAFYGGDLLSPDLGVWSFLGVVARGQNHFVAVEGDDNFRLDVKKSNGFVTGQVTDFITGRKTALKGVVLQQKNSARGYFLSGGRSGSFSLEPGS